MTLNARALSLGFAHRVLAKELSLEIAPGQCWAVLGNNGSGKTTLLQTLAGIRKPLAGDVSLDGRSLVSLNASQRARAVGLLLQEEPIEFWGSVLEYVELGRYPHHRARLTRTPDDERIAADSLSQLELTPLGARAMTTLSGGERQRARLALLLTQRPIYYLLDEPLQHLDLRHQKRVLEQFAALAARGGAAVVMVLHDPSLAQRYCDHALLLYDEGLACAGSRQEVLTAAHLERLYGIAVTL